MTKILNPKLEESVLPVEAEIQLFKMNLHYNLRIESKIRAYGFVMFGSLKF